MSADTEIDTSSVRQSAAAFAQSVLDINLFDYQTEFVDADTTRKAAVCGRQVGKTEMCAVDGLHAAGTNPGVTVLITAPTQRQSSELFRRVKELINQSPVDDWGVERQTQTIIEFANDSRVICLPTGTDGSTIRGYTADYIIVDEAAFVADEVFTSVLLPMLATTDGTLALASTPFGKDGFLFEEAWTGDDWHVTHVPSNQSPLVDESFVADQEATLSTLEFRQEIEGKFVESANAFFPRELVTSATDADASFTPSAGVTVAADVARHGADRTVILPMDGNGVTPRDKIVSDADLNLTEAVGHVRRLYERYDADSVVVDETGVGAGPVEMLESDLGSRVVTGIKFTIDTKQSMYNQLKSDREDGRVTLPDHYRLRREFTDLEYEMTRGGKTKIHHPDGGHDDHSDAVALAAHGRRQTGDAGEVLAFQL